MSTVLIYNATVWKWNRVNADFTVAMGELGRAEPDCFVLVTNGFIIKVSESGEVAPSFDEFETVVNAHGRLLLPGLTGKANFWHDSIVHSLYYIKLFDHFQRCVQTLTYMLRCLAKVNTLLISPIVIL